MMKALRVTWALLVFSGTTLAAILPGDINVDGYLDSQDVLLLANYLAGNIDDQSLKQRQGTDQFGLGDVDADGRLSSNDLTLIQNKQAGNQVELLYPDFWVEYLGGGQSGRVDQYLVDPVGVYITYTSTGQSVVGMDVHFQVSSGSGSVENETVSTEEDGVAVTRWKLGTTSTCIGQSQDNSPVYLINDQLIIQLQDCLELSFYAFATPDEPDHMLDECTDPVICLIKTNLYYYFCIRLHDRFNNAIPYYSVEMAVISKPPDSSGADIVDYDPGLGDKTYYNGTIYPRLIVGNRPGDYVYEVRAHRQDTGPDVTITETVSAAIGPAVICYSQGNNQVGFNGQTLPNPSFFGAMEYVWNEGTQLYDPHNLADIPLSFTVTALSPSDPIHGSAAPSSGFTNSQGYLGTLVTLPMATQIPCMVEVLSQTTDPDFIPPFNQIKGFHRIIPDRELKLFLDVDGNWESNHQDDSPSFIPGSNLDGTSCVVPTNEIEPIQTVRLIAVFYDRFNNIMPPPIGITKVRFTLEETSAFVGLAMNYGSREDLDFQFTAGAQNQQNIEVNFDTNNLAIAPLKVYDFGGRTRVRVSSNEWLNLSTYGEKTVFLPRDDNNDSLPDAGYWAEGHYIDTSSLDSFEDFDFTPEATFPSGGDQLSGVLGDGLTVYEEFRGFVCMGTHIRTDPDVKDLFVVRQKNPAVGASLLTDSEYLEVGLGFITNSEIHAHEISYDFENYLPPGEMPNEMFSSNQKLINQNFPNGNGILIPHIYTQFALKFTFKLHGAQPLGVLGITERIHDPDYPDIPSQIQYSAVNVDNFSNLSLINPGAVSLYATNPVFKINLLKSILSHEIFHALHVCHSIPLTEPPESCGDNAVIDPDPVYPPDWGGLYIMQSGGRFYNYLIDSIANTTLAVPQDYHVNSIHQVRFHNLN